MQIPTKLQLAIQFARRRAAEGLTFDEISERTALYLYQQLNCSVIEAEATGLRAAVVVDSEYSSLYMDLSTSTSDEVAITNPATGERSIVSMAVVVRALQCLARSTTATA